MEESSGQTTIRVLYSALLPAVRFAAAASIPLKELKRLIELAYYQEARRRRFKLKEITRLLSVSMAKAGLLSRQLKEHFARPESERGLPRRILALLWAGPLSEVRIAQVLDDVESSELSEALRVLQAEQRIEAEQGRTVVRYRLAAPQHRLVHDHWMARIDGLNNLMRSISQAVEARFLGSDERAFARTLSFRVKSEQVPKLEQLYREQIFPLVTQLDAEVGEEDGSLPLTLSITWAVDQEAVVDDENRRKGGLS
ncbi:MAG: hypothetical protein JW797_16130 [Bradymonadales bacterium]|nr:hypothetical protein [Bradymonadales bacterium]